MGIKELKQPIRAFMQAHYTDERLAQLLAHAQEGKLSFCSCCCFIGVSTDDHSLKCELDPITLLPVNETHLGRARKLDGARSRVEPGPAERAFLEIKCSDEGRRRLLIPMIRAEMKRRERLRTTTPIPQFEEALCPSPK